MSYFVFIFGLIIGSFLNVVIYRLPRHESLLWPGSHCPHCQKQLRAVDLIPVLSFIIHRAKCRYCRQPISWQYPLVEILTGLIFLMIYQRFGITWPGLFYTTISAIALVTAFIDFKWQIIPNTLMAFGLGLGLIIMLVGHPLTWSSALIGFLLAGLIMLAIYTVSGGKMGGGDVKFLAIIGLYLGWPQILMVLFISFVIGALISLILLVTRIRSLRDAIPFGPFISLGTVITIIWGPQLASWYLSLYGLS